MNERPNLVRRTVFPRSDSRAVVTPLQPSVVYASPDPDALDAQYEGRAKGYTYGREGHPNADVLAAMIDLMEGGPFEEGQGGIVTGSGMSAVTATLLGLLSAGDHVVGGNQLYGRSLRMLTQDLPRWGIAATLANPTDLQAMEAAIRPETRLLLVEVVSNPTLRIADMAGIERLARERELILVVDNTFTTPYAFRAFDRGADVVIHSVTKLLAGHSDVTLGYVLARDPARRKAVYDTNVTLGLTPSPWDCWMAERGLYTFDLRFERAQANAAALADLIADHPAVEAAIYPGRTDHPDHDRARDLLGGQFGNMVSFRLKGGRDEANALARAAPQIAFAPTLGDVGTTLSHPASSSHRALTPEARADLGITEGFYRVSVGCEPFDLLARDFGAALDAAR
ncbi:aminotransferase class I/II-fold pyridoxal phosphate-dependent enzyme [Jannaschia sp. S6380]|uniref:trans-sulfuration enzyme family protein n=1 Tax=Jannaschia sp. S6380 TaxID=2926408 RepID=UPI001FF3F1A0|nr:aminotransferase class I/II-fold pyridoxal phosphate-dependent enzyme [Jannaschia sp. S6380]MCK0166557.1 aminotransferase class I/II-fold pyridoxal phosphate-dependent enzyme [Jannaschia sp. S6380]